MVVKLNFASRIGEKINKTLLQEKQGSRVVFVIFTVVVCVCVFLIIFSCLKYMRLNREIAVLDQKSQLSEQKAAELAQKKEKESQEKAVVAKASVQQQNNEDSQADVPEITVKAVIKISGQTAACVNIKDVGEGIMLKPGMIFLDKGKVLSVDDKGMKWSWNDKNYSSTF